MIIKLSEKLPDGSNLVIRGTHGTGGTWFRVKMVDFSIKAWTTTVEVIECVDEQVRAVLGFDLDPRGANDGALARARNEFIRRGSIDATEMMQAAENRRLSIMRNQAHNAGAHAAWTERQSERSISRTASAAPGINDDLF